MKKLISAVLVAIAVGAFARVLWLKEFAEERSYSQMFLYLGIMMAAGITFSQLKRRPSRKKVAPEVVIRTADREYEPATPDFEARRDALPGWQMRLRSPFEPKRPVTSWIGGVPVAPPDFVWPRRDQGDALHFVAQIDLADIAPEPETGGRPALPDAGAMLIFITERIWSGEAERPSYQVLFLTPEDMANARPVRVPEDLRMLKDLGFFIEVPTFHYWPVDLVPYLDTDKNQINLPHVEGTDWIDNWGLAAFEVRAAFTAMENELNQRKSRAAYEERRDKTMPNQEYEVPKRNKVEFLKANEKPVYDAIKAFLKRADAKDPIAPVDATALSDVLALRQALANEISTTTIIKSRMTPLALGVFSELTLKFMDRDSGSLASAPSACHTFLTNQITARNHHRLFGLAVPAMTDFPDLRGLDCLLTLDSDLLLGTQTEHENGFSIWCDRDEMAQGLFETGRVIWHTNV